MKKANKKLFLGVMFKAFVLVIIITMLGTSVVFAGNNSVVSRKIFESALKSMADKYRQCSQIIPNNEKQSGVFEYDRITKYNTTSRLSSSDGSMSKENYNITFSDGKFLIETEKFKALYDTLNKKIFAKKVENGKEVGDTLYLDNVSYMDESNYIIEKYLDELESFVKVDGDLSLKDTYEFYAIVLEYVSSNLKDSYFNYELKNGVHEFSLVLNKEQMSELVTNVLRDCLKDKKLREWNPVVGQYSDAEIEAAINDVKKSFDSQKDLKLELTLYSKALSFKFMGGKINFTNGSTNLNGELTISDNLITFTMDSSYEDSYYDYDMFYLDNYDFSSALKTDIVKKSYEFKLMTDDGKSFDKSSKIIASLKSNDGEVDNLLEIVVAGDSNKGLLDSSRITLSGLVDDEKLDDILVVSAVDKKPLNKSSNISLEANYEGKNQLLGTVISNDKKALLDSNDILLKAPELFEANLKIQDKKGVKNIKKSSNVKISAKLKDIEMVCEYKANTEFLKAKKITGKFVSKHKDNEYKLDFDVSSKDNKPIKESKQLKGTFKIINDKNTADTVFDTKEGFTYNIHSESSFMVSDIKMKLTFKDVKIDKLFDVKNAKEANDYEILEILDDEFYQLITSLDYDDSQYDEYVTDYYDTLEDEVADEYYYHEINY